MKTQLDGLTIPIYTIAILILLLFVAMGGDTYCIARMLIGWMMLHMSLKSVMAPLPK